MHGSGIFKVLDERMIAPKHIRTLEAYKPGKSIIDAAKEFGVSKWIKLASNENPLGVSPKAKQASQKALSEGNIYPHPRAPELTEALAKKFGRKEEEIFCANGIDAILQYTITAFSDSNDEILTSQGSFIGIYVNTKKLGRTLKLVPLKNYAYDLEKIAEAVSEKTKIIYLANPNNPTGTAFLKKEWELFLKKIPERILIILDEAYYEYASHDADYPNGLDYSFDRLIVTRTFSKAYGMANYRVGYAFSNPSIIAEIQKVKLPFEPSGISSRAAAAAITDEEFLSSTQKLNQEGLTYFREEFTKLNLKFVEETYGNFLMLIFDSEKELLSFNELCLKSGLILRPLGSFGIPNAIRINTGTKEQNTAAIEIIKNVLQQRKVS